MAHVTRTPHGLRNRRSGRWESDGAFQALHTGTAPGGDMHADALGLTTLGHSVPTEHDRIRSKASSLERKGRQLEALHLLKRHGLA